MIERRKNKEKQNDKVIALGNDNFARGRNALFLVFSTLITNLFALAVPLVTLQVYDRILAFQSIGTLQVLCMGVIVIVILDVIIKLCRSSLIGWSSARYEHAAYARAIKHLMGADFLQTRKYSAGEQLHRLASIGKLKSFNSGQSLISLIELPFVVVFIGFIAWLAGWLALVPLTLLAVFSLYALSIGQHIKKNLQMRDKDDDRRINFISEVLGKIHTVKMLGLETVFQRQYESFQAQTVVDTNALNERNAQSYNAAALFTQIMMVSMIAIGAVMVLNGQITMGVLIACVLLSGRIMQPVQRTLTYWISYQEYRLAKGKMADLFAIPLQTKIEFDNLPVPKGKLEIKNMDFGYSDNEDALLFDNTMLTLNQGKIISLGGPVGDGKTTLLKLIAGLYTPSNGHIKIDGIDVSQIPSGEIAKYIGYLPSEADIFQGTIMENLTSFRPEMEQTALEIADYLGIDSVVSKLAKGYQTVLFNGPADPITPGMKQRITIARVLVNKPRLLLFDFADKSLDKDGYNHLFRLLGQLKGQATMILASNDRNILHMAQEEYVIEAGQLVPKDNSKFSKTSASNISFVEFRK